MLISKISSNSRSLKTSKLIMSKIEEVYPSDNDESYTSKPGHVFLGFVDTAIKEADEASIEDTFVGGEPVWLHPESQPDPKLLECGACKSAVHMKLLLQAFAPLDSEQVETVAEELKIPMTTTKYINSDDERVLYVFVCTKCPRKGNSVRCIRGVKRNEAMTSLASKMEGLTAGKDFQINPFDLSKNTQNPFTAGSALSSNANPFDLADKDPFKIEKSTANQQVKDAPSAKLARKEHDAMPDKQFDRNKAFPGFFLYVEEESFKNKTPDHLKLPDNLKIDKTVLDLSGEEEQFSKSPIKLDPRTEKLSKFLDDDVFQKFQEIVGYNPYQVLRYDFGGKPLYYAQVKADVEKTVPAPAYNPSSRRIFEMQLMPKLILDLEETVSLNEGMEWGTILIFTDIENYVPKFDNHGIGYVEECVRVQWESSK